MLTLIHDVGCTLYRSHHSSVATSKLLSRLKVFRRPSRHTLYTFQLYIVNFISRIFVYNTETRIYANNVPEAPAFLYLLALSPLLIFLPTRLYMLMCLFVGIICMYVYVCKRSLVHFSF